MIGIVDFGLEENKLRGLSPRTNYTDRAKLVSSFAGRVCHVVSVMDPHGRILGFVDQSRCFFFEVALDHATPL
jgi:CBS-domain-containing membrane protein